MDLGPMHGGLSETRKGQKRKGKERVSTGKEGKVRPDQ